MKMIFFLDKRYIINNFQLIQCYRSRRLLSYECTPSVIQQVNSLYSVSTRGRGREWWPFRLVRRCPAPQRRTFVDKSKLS